jgi:hypothetical protein
MRVFSVTFIHDEHLRISEHGSCETDLTLLADLQK